MWLFSFEARFSMHQRDKSINLNCDNIENIHDGNINNVLFIEQLTQMKKYLYFTSYLYIDQNLPIILSKSILNFIYLLNVSNCKLFFLCSNFKVNSNCFL